MQIYFFKEDAFAAAIAKLLQPPDAARANVANAATPAAGSKSKLQEEVMTTPQCGFLQFFGRGREARHHQPCGEGSRRRAAT